MNTNYSTPNRTLIAALNTLRKALASGHRAKLVKARNEDCKFPIQTRLHDTDFRNYESSGGHAASRRGIKEDDSMTDFQKHLSLNYVTCFGTPEAMEQYYNGSKLTPDNHKGVGCSHLVLVDDLITMLLESGHKPNSVGMYQRQYIIDGCDDVQHFYNFYQYKHGSMYVAKEFKRRVWVVVLLKDNENTPRTPVLVHVLNVLAVPLKFVPQRSVLKMDDYKCVTYRIGSVVNGFSVEFNIPKKFSFTEA